MAGGQMIRKANWPGSKRAAHFRRKLPQQVRRRVDVRFDQEAKGREALHRRGNERLESLPRRAGFHSKTIAPSPQLAILAQHEGVTHSRRESPSLEIEAYTLRCGDFRICADAKLSPIIVSPAPPTAVFLATSVQSLSRPICVMFITKEEFQAEAEEAFPLPTQTVPSFLSATIAYPLAEMNAQFVSYPIGFGTKSLLLRLLQYPHSQRVPLLLSAKFAKSSAAIIRQSRFVPTIAGAGESFVVPVPSTPSVLRPHAHAEPSFFNARLWLKPEQI